MKRNKIQVSDLNVICRALGQSDGTSVDELLLIIGRLLARSESADERDAELAAFRSIASQAVPYVAANGSDEASELAFQLSQAVIPRI